jgi:hypothetical protein
MIIFNFGAVIILVIAVAIGMGLDTLFPALFHGVYASFAGSLIAVIVGGAGELFGIRGRLFFIPIWLIGLAVMMSSSHELWGTWGVMASLVLSVALCGFGLWWLINVTRKMEARRWVEAGAALSQLKSYSPDGEPKQFWRLVRESLFLPVMGDLSDEIRVHDLEVARVVKARESKQMPADEFAAWAGLTAFLEKSGQQDKQGRSDLSLKKQIERFVHLRLQR